MSTANWVETKNMITKTMMFENIVVCNISEWSQCYESEGNCLKNRTVCSDVQVTNCPSEWSTWTEWSTCSFNATGGCEKIRKMASRCGRNMTDVAECQPHSCKSSKSLSE